MIQDDSNNGLDGAIFVAATTDEGEQFVPMMPGMDLGEYEGELPELLPLVELRNNVFFPRTISPISIGRSRTRRLVRELPKSSPLIAIVAQKNPEEDRPEAKGLFRVGTLARVHKVVEMPDNHLTLLVEGLKRIRIDSFVSSEPYFTVTCSLYEEQVDESSEAEQVAQISVLREQALQYLKMATSGEMSQVQALSKIGDLHMLTNLLCMQLNVETRKKQTLLEVPALADRVTGLLKILQQEVQVLELREEFQQKTKHELEEQHREYMIQQQIRTLQEELGETEDDDYVKFEAAGKKLKLTEEAREAFERELKRLRKINPMAADYAIQSGYLQFFVDLPWGKFSKDNHDLERAQRILDEDHFGLEKVKDRIMEYLAVLKLKSNLKSPILCLYGPPGVGKTSLGKSIARALGRKYERISMGGMHDESEIRGHRRTYIGAQPGRILLNLRKAKTSNPVFLLDEIDKIYSGHQGDPAAALLEVLDPEQNTTFHDNYLEVEYDLSSVLFITTANDISAIPAALRDRMEMIEMTGYLVEEKIAIAHQHLIPNQLKENGVKKSQFAMTDELLEQVVQGYTRESGVRKLNQEIAKLVRHQARKIASEEKPPKQITIEDVRTRLGMPRFLHDDYDGKPEIGVAVGMAWTQVGGEILYVESSLSPGKGQLNMTGMLGDVMKESTTIALQIIKARSEQLGIDPKLFEEKNVHVHVPEGAIPKDGPSAGVTMVTSLVSAFLRKVPKASVAMTGEITLRGRVLPVGGIKEKILAAKRAKIDHIILPAENRKDIEEIKPIYIEGLMFSYIESVDELLALVF